MRAAVCGQRFVLLSAARPWTFSHPCLVSLALAYQVTPHSTTGRADYFGQLVNRAARFCHVAAQGGQVGMKRGWEWRGV